MSGPNTTGPDGRIFEDFDKEAPAGTAEAEGRPIDAMLNVGLHVQVVVGRSRMPIAQLLKLSRGSVIELDRRIGDPVDIVVSNVTIGRGDLVKLEDGKLGVTIKEIIKEYVPKEG
ncbi:MAG: FliM/FliN family flagellar motor switch protein [Myxococcales bacterium]|jgi:flagellar motor switch protein FliN/FliY|nr:FliM/FliN family flagellar motor switch protein [Myxococcales bacterium]